MSARAILFVDGNNWYHSLRRKRIGAPAALDYAKISLKLIGPRQWLETRYYIGALQQSWNPQAYAEQRRFLSRLGAMDPRINVLLGRLEPRREVNPLATELGTWLDDGPQQIGAEAAGALRSMAARHGQVLTLREKAVDVMLAVDLIRLALEDRYDAAYILSADGDFTPAAETAIAAGKIVYAASPDSGYALSRVVKTFIPLKKAWFQDCYLEAPLPAPAEVP